MLIRFYIALKKTATFSLVVILILLPVFTYAFLSHEGLLFFGKRIYNPIYEKYDWWALLILTFILFSLLSFLSLFIFNFYLTFNRIIKERNQKKLHSIFTSFIVAYLFPHPEEKENDAKKIKKLKRFTRSRFQKDVFFSSLIQIAEIINTDNSILFQQLIEKLRLRKSLGNLLYSDQLDEKILAMRMMYHLNIDNPVFLKRVRSYSKSSNFALRTEAYTTLIRLMKNEDELVDFIGEKHRLSILDINVMVLAALNNSSIKLNYLKLLSSSQTRKVMVGLLLAKYKYRDNSKSIILILNHINNPDAMLNKLAWDAYLSLVPEEEGFDLIKAHFFQQEEEVKLMILKNLKIKMNTESLAFLHDIIQVESLLLKIEALKIVFKHNFTSFIQYFNAEDPLIRIAYAEVADININ